jgi:hypothetical protein
VRHAPGHPEPGPPGCIAPVTPGCADLRTGRAPLEGAELRHARRSQGSPRSEQERLSIWVRRLELLHVVA